MKMYEVLGIRQGVVGKCRECLADLVKTFTSKKAKFGKKVLTTKYLDVSKPDEVEYQSAIETTVPAELAWITNHFRELFDISYQVNATNQTAKADLVLDDKTLIADVPATALLEMENYVMELKEGAKHIPTLDGSSEFKLDTNERFGVYKAREVKRTKTALEKYVILRSAATDKFPAHTEMDQRHVTVANVQEDEWCSFITVAAKTALLDRCEELLKAIKKAQTRANATEVVGTNVKAGTIILNNLFGPLLQEPLK